MDSVGPPMLRSRPPLPFQRTPSFDRVDDSLLKGLQVLKVEPEPANSTHLPVFEQRSWELGKSVPAGGQLRVVFQLRGLEAGRHSGNVEVCTVSQDCAGAFADLVVLPVTAP